MCWCIVPEKKASWGAIANISQRTLCRVAQNMVKWVNACILDNGGHFQHLLWTVLQVSLYCSKTKWNFGCILKEHPLYCSWEPVSQLLNKLPASYSVQLLIKIMRFRVLIVMTMKVAVFWGVLPCGLIKIDRHLEGTYCLHQGLSNCVTCTTSGTPATVQWYTGLVRKHQWIKNKKMKSTHTHTYML
jgi:hypothetical protein